MSAERPNPGVTPPASEPSEEAALFDAELIGAKQRGALGLNRVRFIAVSLFFVTALVLGFGLGLPRWLGSLPLLAAYWVVSAAVDWAGPRSRRVSYLAGLSVPFVDMPMVFLMQVEAITVVPNPEATSGSNLGIFTALVVLSSFVLDFRQNLVAVAVACVLQVWLLMLTGSGPGVTMASLLVLTVTAWICSSAQRREYTLLGNVVAQQARRAHLSRYFSPDVIASIEDPELERGSRQEVTILFSDIRGFTAIAEKLEGQEVVELLTEFHERMVDVLFAHGGTLDKFTGDGIMAYFGGPMGPDNPAQKAVRCAIAMQGTLAELNEHSNRTPMRMGIGLHTGSVILGAVGSSRRREFTAIGDAVNVASRIEGLTKEIGRPILVSSQTRHLVGESMAFEEVGRLPIRGKEEAVQVFVPCL